MVEGRRRSAFDGWLIRSTDDPDHGPTATTYDAKDQIETVTDAEDRPTQTRVTIPASEGDLAGAYSTRYTYRADGSPNAIFLPAAGDLTAETLTYDYDPTYAMPVDLKTNYAGASYYVDQATYTNLYKPSSISRSTQLVGGTFVAWAGLGHR